MVAVSNLAVAVLPLILRACQVLCPASNFLAGWL
jgi:hypothetical protein